MVEKFREQNLKIFENLRDFSGSIFQTTFQRFLENNFHTVGQKYRDIYFFRNIFKCFVNTFSINKKKTIRIDFMLFLKTKTITYMYSNM